MKGALVIFVAMVVIGVVLYLIDVFYYRRKKGLPAPGENPIGKDTADNPEAPAEDTATEEGEVCCGMHVVCEKTNLSPVTGEIVYYDDEELDRFKGRESTDYSPEEIEEFRDVLLTLLPQDVAGWSRSIQVRGINLPVDVRDELLMIVSELRGQ